MRDEKRAARRRQIEAVAFEVLLEKGYAAASMLAVAKRAGASNETLYRWYGDKSGLFRALVERNAEGVAELLQMAIDRNASGAEALNEVGSKLLAMLLSDQAVALNRAAAMDADQTGVLGKALAEAGRERVRPLLIEALRPGLDKDAENAASAYLALLVGDLQVRRVTGAMAAPSKEEIEERAAWALNCVRRLYPQIA